MLNKFYWMNTNKHPKLIHPVATPLQPDVDDRLESSKSDDIRVEIPDFEGKLQPDEFVD
jgi:hypothetical protein